MSSYVVALSDNPTVLAKLETIFDFIGVSYKTADSSAALKKLLAEDNEYLVGLLYLDSNKNRDEAIGLLNEKLPALPLFQLTEDDTHALPRGMTGTLKYPVTYRQLLSVIREAENEIKSTSSNAANPTLIGTSPQLKQIQSLIRHVSMTDANVLILGESGTGKEVVARNIHHLSLRNDKPFVAVNCGAIPPDLLESELFGHEKGSFTGAISTRKGRFELADGGTLFLDEIGDMPYPMQVKLLRVIQEKTFERVGGTKSIKSDVRLIAATHQDLEKKIGEGKFRMDLYYRLNVFPIELEPLRNRPDDIDDLIQVFATRMELEQNSPIEFAESAIKALTQHQLPGNVRELENLVERLAILYPGETITNAKLPVRYQAGAGENMESDLLSASVTVADKAPNDVGNLKQYLTDLEKSIIENALEESNWVVAKAAKALSLQRTTLVEKIRKLDIQQESAEEAAE